MPSRQRSISRDEIKRRFLRDDERMTAADRAVSGMGVEMSGKVDAAGYAVDLAALNAAIALKADSSSVSTKADTSAMTTALAGKAGLPITFPVTSVNAKTGAAVLNAADVGFRVQSFSIVLGLLAASGTATVADASITTGSVPFAVVIGSSGALDSVRVGCDAPTAGQFVVNLSRLLTPARTYSGWAFWLNP